eukprot:1442711-Alexandrium_andersonii.AAC.1
MDRSRLFVGTASGTERPSDCIRALEGRETFRLHPYTRRRPEGPGHASLEGPHLGRKDFPTACVHSKAERPSD